MPRHRWSKRRVASSGSVAIPPFCRFEAADDAKSSTSASRCYSHYEDGHGGPWESCQKCDRPIRDFRSAWTAALANAGVSDYHFHDFRRTATRNMTLAGVPEKHIMQVTGHKTRHMIDRYNITVERDTHNTLEQTQVYLKQQRQSKHGQNTDTHDEEDV